MTTTEELWQKYAFAAAARAGLGAIKSIGPRLGQAMGKFTGALRGTAAAAPVAGAAAAAPAAPGLMGKAWNMLKHPAVPLAAGVIPAVQGGIQNGIIAAKQKEMMEKGVQDYASGVSTGMAGYHKAIAAMPAWQKAMYFMAPGGALNSQTMRDQLSQYVGGMGEQAKLLAPGIIDQFFTKASPKGSLMGPTIPASDMTMAYLQQQQEHTRQLQEAVQKQIAQMNTGTGAATVP